ncbi:MAG: hypothetical protein IJO76_07335 [Clostridia bacterium]|nr:hypothetical protein [Clostridia bacterium]
MKDVTPKGNIDLDALLQSLLEDKAGKAPTPLEEEQATPIAEPVAEALPAEPVEEPTAEPVAEEISAAPVAEEPVSDAPAEEAVHTEEEAVRPKKKGLLGGLFRRHKEEDGEDEDWDDWGLKPIGHYRVQDVKPTAAEPSAEPDEEEAGGLVDEFPPVQAVAETITMQVVLPSGEAIPRAEQATRVIDVNQAIAAEEAPMPIAMPEPQSEEPPLYDEQLPDQLSLEELVRVEDVDPDGSVQAEEVDEQELLERARQERIRDFTLSGEEEETNEPEEEAQPEVEEEPAIEDFTSYEDTKAVQLELVYRTRMSLFGLLATALLELVLLVLTLLTVTVGESPITAVGYLTVHAFALGLMMAVNYSSVIRGLSGLFTLRANGDTPSAVASAVAFLAVLLHFIDSTMPLPFWAPVAGVTLVFAAVAKYAHAVSVRRNFSFVSYQGEKYSAALVEDETALRDIGRRAVGDGEAASIAYFRRTGFLSDYLANAYEDDLSDDWARWSAPIGLGLSLVLSLTFLLGGQVVGLWDWLRLFTGLVCLSMPCVRLAVQLPLGRCCRYMLSRGGFLVGWKAVRRFGNPDGLVVDVADLYPDESMLLHGIKTFAGAHIDDAILDAASLSVRSGGPLSMIFRRIIQNKEELLHEVDTLVYEQGMGLSGWVDGRRVLVGNRRLLQNHGVDVPSADYEARYARDGRRLVYLSTAGELSAMFVVSYLPDPEIQGALQGLCRTKATLLVRSCDPNITAESLCADFELDDYYVDVLPAAAGRQYVQLLQEGESESTAAVLASNGHVLGTAKALSACRSLWFKGVAALFLLTLCAAVSMLLCIVWTLNSTLTLFQPIACLIVSMALSLIAASFRRI